MKTVWLILCVLCVAVLPVAATAQDDGFGLGLIVGEPTGIALKQWTGPRTELAAGIAWSFVDEDAFHLHGDYLIHSTSFAAGRHLRSPFYYGLGARLKGGDDDTWLGVRVPLGVAFFVNDAPLDFFVEIAPLMDLVPETEFRINAALGVRYYFGRG